MQDLLESAYNADIGGDTQLAVKRYRAGAEAIEIGLRVDARETGLGQKFDNAAQWKHELREWQQHVSDRCGHPAGIFKGLGRSKVIACLGR
jgi:hypothetical protein